MWGVAGVVSCRQPQVWYSFGNNVAARCTLYSCIECVYLSLRTMEFYVSKNKMMRCELVGLGQGHMFLCFLGCSGCQVVGWPSWLRIENAICPEN